VLLKARAKRGAIDFETTETRMIFDDNGKIAQIVPEVRNDAHRLIEECMLAANVCASDFLATREHPGAVPRPRLALRGQARQAARVPQGVRPRLGGGDEPRASDYARLLEQIKDRPDAQLLQTVMLRSLKQAMYSPDNVGHFGLAYESYTHFTSPIRRYPDLLIHRGIKAALAGEQYRPGRLGADRPALLDDRAPRRRGHRDVVAFLKCYFMQDRVGEEFTGSVSAVVPFGLFVALDDIFIEGLLHISDSAATTSTTTGARRHPGPAQPRRLPARGRRRRRARRGRTQGPRGGAQRHRDQGGQRCRRHRALHHRDQPTARSLHATL
jgi:ribonuclease R